MFQMWQRVIVANGGEERPGKVISLPVAPGGGYTVQFETGRAAAGIPAAMLEALTTGRPHQPGLFDSANEGGEASG